MPCSLKTRRAWPGKRERCNRSSGQGNKKLASRLQAMSLHVDTGKSGLKEARPGAQCDLGSNMVVK